MNYACYVVVSLSQRNCNYCTWHCLKLKPFIIFEHCSNSTKSLKYLWFCWVSECQRLPDAFKNICTYNYHFDEMRRVVSLNFGRALKTWYVIKTSFFFWALSNVLLILYDHAESLSVTWFSHSWYITNLKENWNRSWNFFIHLSHFPIQQNEGHLNSPFLLP